MITSELFPRTYRALDLLPADTATAVLEELTAAVSSLNRIESLTREMVEEMGRLHARAIGAREAQAERHA